MHICANTSTHGCSLHMSCDVQFPGAQPSNQSAWTNSGTSAGVDPGVASSLCNNELGKPCGSIVNQSSTPPLSFIKFQVSCLHRLQSAEAALRLRIARAMQAGSWSAVMNETELCHA